MIESADNNTQDTDTIRVQVRTRYLSEQSRPEHSRYVYGYTITIFNDGEEPAQLMSRHWIISDDKDQVTEVKGAGVVGEQPIIQPGSSYTYSSGVVMESAVGTMTGSYRMQSPNGDTFDAPIPTFTLIQPSRLH
ncbi:MAG TPA: Co2+/Mg2+ efflux protein ApaG [Marinagarivorans sp.]